MDSFPMITTDQRVSFPRDARGMQSSQATAPLARLLGYSRSLAQLTAGTAQGVLCLSHYDSVGRESIE